jgi:hypothetical protein
MALGVILGVLGGAVVVGLALLLLARRSSTAWLRHPDHASGILQAAGGVFAVVMAFVILIAFEGFVAVRTSAEDEASATLTVFETGDFLPARTGRVLQGRVICYARAVVALDWPAMERGERSPRVDASAASIEGSLRGVRATGAAQKSALDEVFTEYNSLQQGRAERHGGDGEVPAPVWIVLVLNAAGLFGFVLLFSDAGERLLAQAVMVGAITMIIVGSFLLIWFLSHPYEGEMGSLKPTAMQGVLDEMQSGPIAGHRSVSIPCDSDGQPLPG